MVGTKLFYDLEAGLENQKDGNHWRKGTQLEENTSRNLWMSLLSVKLYVYKPFF